jgi:hypothetical protein
MPQLDLYNFFLIIFYSIIGIIIMFIFFQKHWLYSWKLLTLISTKIKNLNNSTMSILSKTLVVFFYSFFFFNSIICFFFSFLNYTLIIQSKLSNDFNLISEINQLKFFL